MFRVRSLCLVALLLAIGASLTFGGGRPEETEPGLATIEEGVPQYGGTLTVTTIQRSVRPPRSWDPVAATDSTSTGWTSPYLESLLEGDVSRGAAGTGEHRFSGRYIPTEYLRGQLAESWEFANNPLRLIFHIREGVYWHGKEGVMESRELTAEDVAFNLNRRFNTPGPGDSEPRKWNWVDSIEATDKYTVTLRLNRIHPDWDTIVGWGWSSNIMPPELVDAGAEDWRNAVGTGPWMLTEYVDGSYAEYTRNENYWGTTTIDGKEYQLPFTDKLVWPIMSEEATQIAALRTGRVDIDEQVTWEFRENLNRSNPMLNSWEVDGWTYFGMFPRIDNPQFSDVNVRRAMSMAVDREQIVERVYGGYGVDNHVIAKAWGSDFYSPFSEISEEVDEAYSYNPERARELLAETDYPDGFSFEGMVVNSNLEIAVMSLVKDYWSEHLNIDMTIRPITDIGVAAGGNTDTLAAFSDDSPGPWNTLFSVFAADVPANIGQWENSEYAGILDRIERAEDPEDQVRLAKEAANLVVDDMAAIFLPGYNFFVYAWPWVRNYEGELASGYRHSTALNKIIWIDQEMKKEMGY